MTFQDPPSFVSITWATCPKWATRSESEAVEVVESLDGSRTIAMIDVQGSGSAGGRRLALSLLAFIRGLVVSGATPATALAATDDHLRALKSGKVGAAIHLSRIAEGAVEISGFGPLTLWASGQDKSTYEFASGLAGVPGKSEPGLIRLNIPPIRELVLANDGVATSGPDLANLVQPWSNDVDAQSLVHRSITQDGGRARSDKSVVVLRSSEHNPVGRVSNGGLSFLANTKLDRM